MSLKKTRHLFQKWKAKVARQNCQFSAKMNGDLLESFSLRLLLSIYFNDWYLFEKIHFTIFAGLVFGLLKYIFNPQ